MPRYALQITYDGAPFAGFQWQNEQPSVQGVIERAMHHLGSTSERLVAAGRTDSGVHAIGQVVSFDIPKAWDPFRLAEAMNYHMKAERVGVLAAAEVEEDFSARFSALGRRYLFRILMRRAPQSFGRGTSWQIRHELDVEAMQRAANYLIGQHDFTTFRSSICQAQSPIKTLDRLDVESVESLEGREVHFHVEARSFLHNQVRSFVGTLERVGAGAWAPERVRDALEAADRSKCGPVSPPHGLYLAAVDYGRDIFEYGYRDFG